MNHNKNAIDIKLRYSSSGFGLHKWNNMTSQLGQRALSIRPSEIILLVFKRQIEDFQEERQACPIAAKQMFQVDHVAVD